MNWKAIRGAALLHLLSVAVCVLGAQAFASGVCPGGPVTVTLYSPASGTHPTPVMVSATATSTGGAISGYVVYTDVPTAGTNAYQINATSLNAWVILPLLQNGGAQTQHVYVRAWDVNGNCNDTPTVTITASGTVVPTPLGGYVVFDNADDDSGGDGGVTHGWGYCGDCAGGNPSNRSPPAFNQSPNIDGGSLLLSMTGGNNADALWWYKVGPQNQYRNFLWDFWFRTGSNVIPSKTQAVEFDLFQEISGLEYMFGSQCEFQQSVWQGWRQDTGAWVNAIPNTATDANPTGTAIPCTPFAPGVWHQAQYFVQRQFNGRLLYGNVTIDGVTTQWNINAPNAAKAWADVLGVNHQLDVKYGYSGTTTLQEWVDLERLTVW